MKLKQKKTRALTIFEEHGIIADTMMAKPMKSLKLHNQFPSF